MRIINVLKAVLVLLVLVLIVSNSSTVYAVDYKALIPDTIELVSDYDWNKFNYQFCHVGIKLVYNIKEKRPEVIVNNMVVQDTKPKPITQTTNKD